MSSDKYIAILDRYAGEASDSAFCIVLAKQISNSIDGYIVEEAKVLREFNGFREIFVPKLKQRGFKVGQVLSLTIEEVFPQEGRNPRVHFLSAERVSAPICIELKKIEVDDLFLNIELLQEVITSRFTASETNFYVSDGIDVYGDFRIEKNKIVAGVGVEVNGYMADECLKIDHPYTDHNDISILLYLPKNSVRKYDCSTNTQLIERVKDIISKSKLTDETRRYINHIKALVSNEDLDGLELAKINKVQALLGEVSLKYDEFEALRSNSGFWSGVFDNSIKEFEERLANDFLEKKRSSLELEMLYETEKLISIQQHLIEEERKLNKIETMILSENEVLNSINNQIGILEHKKDEIILSFHVQERIGSIASKGASPNFEIQQSSNQNNTFYDRLNYFLDDLSAILVLEDAVEDGLIKVIKQFNDSNFFTCSNVKHFMTLAHIMGNAQIYLNNAEVDWIKFDKFMNQGLLEAFEYAHDNPSLSVFYLLQDFNLASPECYAKPLIDLSRNIRKTFPVDGRAWPSNLRVVFFPLELEIEDFGFDVNDETFSTWSELDVPFLDYKGVNLSMAFNLERR